LINAVLFLDFDIYFFTDLYTFFQFKNRMTKMAIVDRKRIRKQNNLKVLEGGNDAEDGGEWETAE